MSELENIDLQINNISEEMNRIVTERKRLTFQLDENLRNLEIVRENLKKQRESLFLKENPIMYVIVGEAEAIDSKYISRKDYKQIVACFTTEEAANAALGQKKVLSSHYDYEYTVKVEATVNIPKNIRDNVNSKTYRRLEWSP